MSTRPGRSASSNKPCTPALNVETLPGLGFASCLDAPSRTRSMSRTSSAQGDGRRITPGAELVDRSVYRVSTFRPRCRHSPRRERAVRARAPPRGRPKCHPRSSSKRSLARASIVYALRSAKGSPSVRGHPASAMRAEILLDFAERACLVQQRPAARAPSRATRGHQADSGRYRSSITGAAARRSSRERLGRGSSPHLRLRQR